MIVEVEYFGSDTTDIIIKKDWKISITTNIFILDILHL